MMRRSPLAPLVLAAMLAISAAAQASVFVATLTGAQEVPATGSPGGGGVLLLVDDGTLSYTLAGGYFGLGAATSLAHIHAPAGPGVNAGVLLPLIHSGGTDGTLLANGVFTPGQFAHIQAGLAYVNVHTSAFPGGEIRGQLLAVPEPSTYALIAGLGLCAFAGYRRFERA